MRNSANRIAKASHHTDGIEGYVFDGSGGSQMAFWTCSSDAVTAEHVNDFDEYFIVVEGGYFLQLDGNEISVAAGQECYIPKGLAFRGALLRVPEQLTCSEVVALHVSRNLNEQDFRRNLIVSIDVPQSRGETG